MDTDKRPWEKLFLNCTTMAKVRAFPTKISEDASTPSPPSDGGEGVVAALPRRVLSVSIRVHPWLKIFFEMYDSRNSTDSDSVSRRFRIVALMLIDRSCSEGCGSSGR